uniref:Uncharacterized protein n=1 Tax=Anopheles albimanus TaxID=7167 RepID=A0A182F2R8_ANOAL
MRDHGHQHDRSWRSRVTDRDWRRISLLEDVEHSSIFLYRNLCSCLYNKMPSEGDAVRSESEASSSLTSVKAAKAGKESKTKPHPSTLHGTDYQLKITLWILLNAKRIINESIDTNCSVTAEDPLGGKFDDTVLRLRLPDGRKQALYIQAKHKNGTANRITIADLLAPSDKAFSLTKYYQSFRILHRKGMADDAKFVVCTNAGISKDVAQVLEHPPPGMDTSDRVHIFLDDAGFGKTTYMTWLAWYFAVHRQSCWTIRLNAIEYSYDFEQIMKDHGATFDTNEAVRILFQLIQLELQALCGRLRILESLVNKKLALANLEKSGSSNTASFIVHRQLDTERLNDSKRSDLALLGIYTIFPSECQLLSKREQNQCKKYLQDIAEGREKSGIVEGVQAGVPLFIHRMFAEYFAACWLFESRDRHEVKLFLKSRSYWENRNVIVRRLFDEIAIRDENGIDSKAHLAVMDYDENKLMKEIELDNMIHQKRDAIGRTPLHLAVQHFAYARDQILDTVQIYVERIYPPGFVNLLVEKMEKTNISLLIDAKDDLLQWNALDYAFRISNEQAIEYLLSKNASINEQTLLEQLLDCEQAASNERLVRYDKYVMGYTQDIDNHKPLWEHSAKQIASMRKMVQYFVNTVRITIDVDFMFVFINVVARIQDQHNLAITLPYVFDRDVNISGCDDEGRNLLQLSAALGQFTLLEYLIARKQFDPMRNAFHYCVSVSWIPIRSTEEGCKKSFQYMMKGSAIDGIHAVDADGRNVFHLAITNNHFQIAKLILSQVISNTPSEMRDERQRAYIDESNLNGRPECSEFLRFLEETSEE